jgi:hypothetical protein
MGQQANLRVQVLGVLAVAVDGREVPPQELASRLDPPAAEGLLALAGTYGSAKYQAQARAAVDRMAAALPAELRPAFLRRGHLAGAVAGR